MPGEQAWRRRTRRSGEGLEENWAKGASVINYRCGPQQGLPWGCGWVLGLEPHNTWARPRFRGAFD